MSHMSGVYRSPLKEDSTKYDAARKNVLSRLKPSTKWFNSFVPKRAGPGAFALLSIAALSIYTIKSRREDWVNNVMEAQEERHVHRKMNHIFLTSEKDLWNREARMVRQKVEEHVMDGWRHRKVNSEGGWNTLDDGFIDAKTTLGN